MRLDEILPDIKTSGEIPYGGTVPMDRSAQIVARGVNQVTETIVGAAADAQRARVARAKAETVLRQQAIRAEGNLLDAQLGTEIGQIEQTAASEKDPETYQLTVSDRLAALRESLSRRVRYPETLTLFAPQIEKAFGQASLKLQHHTDVLRVDAIKGNTTATLGALEQSMAVTPLGDDQAWQDARTRGEQAIETGRLAYGNEATDKMLIDWRKTTADARALRTVNEAPEAFLAYPERFGGGLGLDPKKRVEYDKMARDRLESGLKELNRQREKEQADLAKAVDQERQQKLVDLRARADRGQLAVSELDLWRELGYFRNQGEWEGIYHALTAPRTVPSDPHVLAEFGQAVDGGPVPKTTEDAVWKSHQRYLAGAAGLDYKDAERLASKITAKRTERETLGRTLGNEALTRSDARYHEAVRLIDVDLGYSPMADKYDKEINQLRALMLNELSARTFTSQPGAQREDPITVGAEIRKRYAPTMQTFRTLGSGKMATSLAYPAPTPAEATLKLQDAARQGRIVYDERPGSAYQVEVGKIAEWARKYQPPLTPYTPKSLRGGTSGQEGAPPPLTESQIPPMPSE